MRSYNLDPRVKPFGSTQDLPEDDRVDRTGMTARIGGDDIKESAVMTYNKIKPDKLSFRQAHFFA